MRKHPSQSQRAVVGALAMALSLIVAPEASAQTLLLDFGASATTTVNGASPDDPLRFWNNITDTIGGTSTGQLLDLVTATNTPTSIDFLMVSRFNWSNANGTTASSLYAQDATRDSLYGNTEAFNGGNPAGSLSNVFPSFKFTSLDPGMTYDFTFYASRTGVADNRETRYTILGLSTASVLLNVANNVNNSVTYANMSPTLEGEITISLSPGPANNNGNHFTYMGVLEVTAVPEPAGVALLAAGGMALLQRRRRSVVG